jgi:hypothetical protein
VTARADRGQARVSEDEPKTPREAFDRLRQMMKGDVRRVLEWREGGNYVAALLIATASESLSKLQDQPDETVFVNLLSKHGLPRGLAAEVFSALRDGLAHVYDTKFIRVDDHVLVELVVSWGNRRHLTVRRDPPGLYLNVRTMWADLWAVFQDLKQVLPEGGELPRRWTKKRVKPADSRSIADWRRWLREHEEGKV